MNIKKELEYLFHTMTIWINQQTPTQFIFDYSGLSLIIFLLCCQTSITILHNAFLLSFFNMIACQYFFPFLSWFLRWIWLQVENIFIENAFMFSFTCYCTECQLWASKKILTEKQAKMFHHILSIMFVQNHFLFIFCHEI